MDSQEYVLSCESYRHLREGKDLMSDSDLVQYFREVISLREKLDDTNRVPGSDCIGRFLCGEEVGGAHEYNCLLISVVYTVNVLIIIIINLKKTENT